MSNERSSHSERDEMIARLIKEKRVYKVKPLAGNGQLLSARVELTPQDHIRLALQLAENSVSWR
jgi:hypothetical protein